MKELNEENITQIFESAVKRDIRDEERDKYIEVEPIVEGGPKLFFKRDIIDGEYENLKDMFGQTDIVHTLKDIFEFGDGKKLHDETEWTNDTTKLGYFYYILKASDIIEGKMHTKDRKIYYQLLHEIEPKIYESEQLTKSDKELEK